MMRKPTAVASSASSSAIFHCIYSELLAVHSTSLRAAGFIQCSTDQPDSELINFPEAGDHGNGQESAHEF